MLCHKQYEKNIAIVFSETLKQILCRRCDSGVKYSIEYTDCIIEW